MLFYKITGVSERTTKENEHQKDSSYHDKKYDRKYRVRSWFYFNSEGSHNKKSHKKKHKERKSQRPDCVIDEKTKVYNGISNLSHDKIIS